MEDNARRRMRRYQRYAEGRPFHPSPTVTLRANLTTRGHGVDKYPAKSHARRVAEKLKATSGFIAIAGSPSQEYPDSDQEVPFRQERYFYYLTGCHEPDCSVSYDIGRDELKLWLPPINEARVVWTGRGSTVEEALEKYDIDDAEYLEDGDIRCFGGVPQAFWGSLGRHAGDLYGNEAIEIYGYQSEVSKQSLMLFESGVISEERSGRRFKHALDSCRVIKDEHEIELIRKANAITADAHIAVLRNLYKMATEAEVEAAYMAVCIANRAREQAYAPIAGSGPNGSMLHYGKNDEDFGHRQTMVMDAGCEVGCYASDVTRTFPLNSANPGNWPSKETREIYELVSRVQEACIKAMRPGKDFLEIVVLSRRMIMEGLLELGVLKGNPEDMWQANTVMGFFPHGLGHHMGLEVHDVSPRPAPPVMATSYAAPFPLPRSFEFTSSALYDGSSSSSGSILEPGMVVTIEPGCYFNHFLLEKFFLNNEKHSKYIDREVLGRYWKVGGVRIEDDILITKDGYENLTTAPKGQEMLEVIRDGAKAGCGC